MKKVLILSIFICLSAISAFAQEIVNTKDFSGDWELDVSKSKLDERSRVESMTMKVVQTNDEIKIETVTKRAEGNGDGRGGRMMGGGGNSNLTYLLNGKESKITQDSPMGAVPVTLKAKLDGDKLKLNQMRTINTQMGEVSITTKETWTLSDGGKTLTVKRDTESPRGTNSSEMVFKKVIYAKVLRTNPTQNTVIAADNQAVAIQRNGDGKTLSGGVVNGKAINLVTPIYPSAARKTKASGQVAVQVTIDEEGNVISAEAVSGNPLLRASSESAARASKFLPTTFEGKPVKVTGTIIYNFVP